MPHGAIRIEEEDRDGAHARAAARVVVRRANGELGDAVAVQVADLRQGGAVLVAASAALLQEVMHGAVRIEGEHENVPAADGTDGDFNK